MLDGALCARARASPRLGGRHGPASTRRPGKASGGWGATDVPPLSGHCSLWGCERLVFSENQRGGEEHGVESSSKGWKGSVQPGSPGLQSGDVVRAGRRKEVCTPSCREGCAWEVCAWLLMRVVTFPLWGWTTPGLRPGATCALIPCELGCLCFGMEGPVLRS